MEVIFYDDEIFIVSYHPKYSNIWHSDTFESEKSALDFIKENRSEWFNYIMVKQQRAIIDER